MASIGYYLVNSIDSLYYIDDSTNAQHSKDDVTIVMAVYNEDPDMFQSSIRAVKEQGCRFIVVGDSSLEPYRSMTEELGGEFIHKEAREGKRKSIAVGMKLVETEFVLIVDSDTILPGNGVTGLLSKFTPEVGGVSGVIKIINEGNPASYSAEFTERAREVILKSTAKRGNTLTLDGACMMFRTSVVKDFILSKEFTEPRFLGRPGKLGDDRQLTGVVINKGFRITRNFNVIVYTRPQKTYRNYFKQQVRWSRAGWRFLFRYIRDGTLFKAGKFYAFEFLFISVLPLSFLALIFTKSYFFIHPFLFHSTPLSFSVLFDRFIRVFIAVPGFVNNHIDPFFEIRTLVEILNFVGVGIYAAAVSSNMLVNRLKTFAYGSIALLILFVANIWGLMTFWKQGSWLTR